MEYLIALFEISKRTRGGVTCQKMLNYLEYTSYGYVFEKRRILEKYLEGKRIIRLMYYFRDYYKNYKK